MSQTIQIVNQHQGILDLSVVKDVNGLPVVLQPKGMPGSSRECFDETANHPRVVAMAGAKWLIVQAGAAAPVVATTEARPPAPAPVEAAPPAPPEPVEATPEPEAAVVETPSETVEASDTLAVTTTEDTPVAAPASESRKNKRHR